MGDFLLALADFDRKKLWREIGHTSLFYYLHRELKLSKGAAQNRKTAAELIQAFPEVEAALRAGELCLSTVNELARVLTPENRAEVLPRFFRLSRREAEAVAASLRPAEVVPIRDVITAIRPAAPALRPATAQAAVPAASPASPTPRAHPDEPRPVAVHPDEPTAPIVVAAPMARPAPPPPRESVELLDAEVGRVHVTVSRRFLEKLEAAKDALGHACPGGSAAEILERGLDLVLAQHAKRQGLVEKPRSGGRGSRRDTIPAEVKRAVWRRAGGAVRMAVRVRRALRLPAAPRVRSHRTARAGRGVYDGQCPARLPAPQSSLGTAGLRRCGDGPLHAPAFDAGAAPAVPCGSPRDVGRWFHAAASGGRPGLVRVMSSRLLRLDGRARLRARGRFPASRTRCWSADRAAPVPVFGSGRVRPLVSSQPRRRARGGDGPRRGAGRRSSDESSATAVGRGRRPTATAGHVAATAGRRRSPSPPRPR